MRTTDDNMNKWHVQSRTYPIKISLKIVVAGRNEPIMSNPPGNGLILASSIIGLCS